MDALQTDRERKRQINLLLSNSSPREQVQIRAALKDRSLREAVIRLGWENDMIRRTGILTDASAQKLVPLSGKVEAK